MQQFSHQHLDYASFWRRLIAFSVDMAIISIITTLLIVMLFGIDYLRQMQQMTLSGPWNWQASILEHGFPAFWAIGFWLIWMATPGKLLMDCQVVDSRTATNASLLQLIIRYLSYILSMIPLGLGFLWILFDKRNQSWHDKLSNTMVIMQDESRHTLKAYR